MKYFTKGKIVQIIVIAIFLFSIHLIIPNSTLLTMIITFLIGEVGNYLYYNYSPQENKNDSHESKKGPIWRIIMVTVVFAIFILVVINLNYLLTNN